MALSPDQISSFTLKAKQAGYSDEQIQQEVMRKSAEDQISVTPPAPAPVVPSAPLMQPSAPTVQAPQPKSIEGFASNIGPSLLHTGAGVGSALLNVLNPDLNKNTLMNLGKTVFGTGEKIAAKVAGNKTFSDDNTKKVDALVNYYKERYGSLGKIGDTLYNDPAGSALDASVLLDGIGGLAKGAGAVADSSRLADIGSTVSDASRAIDPLSQATKIAGKGLGKVSEAMGDATSGIRDDAASYLAKKSIKARPTQVVNFEALTGQDLGKFMSENNVYTLNDANKAIKPLQDTYDAMVRTGKKVPGSAFADALRQKAMDMISTDVSPSARQVANKLWDEADHVDKMGDVTDTILTNSKTSAYGKVSAKAMTDPITDNFNKAYGEVGIQTLENGAKGSAAIGKKLQALREFQDIVRKQAGVGKGSQIINALRPGVGGAIVGNIIPGIGPIGGAVIGEAASNPTVQRIAAKALQGGVPGGGALDSIAKGAYQTGKYGSRLSPDQTSQTETPQLGESTSVNTYPTSVPDATKNVNTDGSNSPSKSLGETPPTLNPYGAPPKIIYREYQNALSAGDTKTATRLKTMYTDEVAYQKASSPSSQKPLSSQQVKDVNLSNNGLRGLDVVKKELGFNDKTGTVGPDAVNKVSQLRLVPFGLGNRTLYKAIFDAAGARLRLESGAALSPDEIKRYVDNYIAQIGDNPTALNYEIKQLDDFLKGISTQKSDVPDAPTVDINQSQGLGDTPPAL